MHALDHLPIIMRRAMSPTLTATSTCTGPTTVSAGRLAVNGAVADSSVTVLFAAELGGSGSIGGLVSVAGGGTLAPGKSIESLAAGTATFAAAATFALIDYVGTWNGGLFPYAGNVLADAGMFMVGSQRWLIDYDLSSSAGLDNFTGDYLPASRFVAITAVPEPSACYLALTSLACISSVVRWRRKRARSRAHQGDSQTMA